MVNWRIYFVLHFQFESWVRWAYCAFLVVLLFVYSLGLLVVLISTLQDALLSCNMYCFGWGPADCEWFFVRDCDYIWSIIWSESGSLKIYWSYRSHFARPSRLTSHDYLWYCYIVQYSRDLFFHCFICQRWKYLRWVFWNNLFDSTLGGHKVAVTWPLKPYELQEVGLFNGKLVNSSAPYFLPKLACCVNLLFACSLIFSSPFPGHPQNWTILLW